MPPVSLLQHRFRFGLIAGMVLACLVMALPAGAIVFFDISDPDHNTSAPGGTYADSGWQYAGVFGDNLGTVIGPNTFITAAHVPTETSFVRLGIFTGGVDETFTVDASAFGSVGFYTVPGTDLRVYQITGTFSNWAELYTGTNETGQTLVTHGKGGQRGAEIYLDNGFGPELKGWYGTGTARVPRWGVNQVADVIPAAFSPVGDLLQADFNSVSGVDEAMLSGNDSGGGVFILDGGTWKLAGVNYAVDGYFNTIPSDTGNFAGELFDKGGYWQGQGSNWQFNPDLPTDVPQSFYASRISPYAAQLQGIAGVPEPGSLLLIGFGLALALRRDSRKA